MSKAIDIIVKNDLTMEKRDVNIYHHSENSAHIISPGSSTALPLKTIGEDYLHISVIRGPGNLLRDCQLNIPPWADFEFSLEGKVTITHRGNRTLLKIPAGPPAWQLKMTAPGKSRSKPKKDFITVDESSADG
ncbi:MAG: hypothetical protein KAT34_07210 [Candidatus Aminicenantes bacterium]|nr:hypothetical protein [Candidatus Aminicenantes bacterium]